MAKSKDGQNKKKMKISTVLIFSSVLLSHLQC